MGTWTEIVVRLKMGCSSFLTVSAALAEFGMTEFKAIAGYLTFFWSQILANTTK